MNISMDKKTFRKLIFTRVDAALEILGYALLLAAFIMAVVACAAGAGIPETFDEAGNIIKYSSPGILFLMPASMLICNLLFSLVLHVFDPSEFGRGMPFKLQPGREIRVYRDMVRMHTVLELLLGLYSLAFNVILYRGAQGAIMPLTGLWVLGVFGDIAVMLAVSARHNRLG